mmetsp:Transcript_75691/g.88038  ORF Transcript_75691/g.88038 Transcript_75691/m.88038 type:complete len:630 (-) Transcript_75691:215-2104(-)
MMLHASPRCGTSLRRGATTRHHASFIFGALLSCLAISSILCGVRADSTAESLVECTPLQVEPNENITCTIYVRDSLQEPTTLFDPSDFYISPVASIAGTVLTVSSATVGSTDATTVTFVVTAASGCNVAINVYLASTGDMIRGGGLVVSVLVWPAARIGTITCTTDSFVNGGLPLRASTTCTADASGNTGLPAVIHPADVLLTEDHFAGTFTFVSGTKQLVFTYQAPSSLSTAFTTFTLRVTLSSADSVYTVSFPVEYPALAPSSASTLLCNSQSSLYCFLTAQDATGPVLFNASQFLVKMEKLDSTNSAWISSTSAFNISLTAGSVASVEKITWALLVNNEISTQRLRVYLASSSSTEVSGSPFVFTSGVSPTPSYVSLRGCNSQYLASANTTQCTIDLLNGVTGDSRYFTVVTTAGGVGSGMTYGTDASLGTPIMTFTYTAPSITLRTEDYLGVTVSGGLSVLNSPLRMIIYPTTTTTTTSTSSTKVPGIIAIGMTFYGTCLVIGFVRFVNRQKRIQKVKLLRAEREHAEKLEEAAGNVAIHHTYATAHLKPTTRSPSQESYSVNPGSSSAPPGAVASAAVVFGVSPSQNLSLVQPPCAMDATKAITATSVDVTTTGIKLKNDSDSD